MSSHHFVREEQEPALYLHDFSGIPMELLGNLLEWSPYVIVNSSQVELYQNLGYKMDAVALIEAKSVRLPEQDRIKEILLKNQNDLRSIAEILAARNQHHYNLVTSEISLNYLLPQLSETQLEVVIYTESFRYILSKKSIYSKWYPAESQLKLVAIDSSSTFTSSGFQSDFKGKSFESPLLLVTRESGIISLTSESQAPFLVAEAY